MNIDRRQFFKTTATAGGAVIFSTHFGCASTNKASPIHKLTSSKGQYDSLYLTVTPKNEFYFTFDKAEMGQGVVTGQATLFGEEADIDPSQLKLQPAPADTRYGTLMGNQITGGSTSTSDRYLFLRNWGAKYRNAVIKAAAREWKTEPKQLRTNNGKVFFAKAKMEKTYADLNNSILEDDFEEEVSLKPSEAFKYIGKPGDTVDAFEKTTGSANYGIDLKVDGMKVAFVMRSPVSGGKLISFEKEKILKIKYVIDVIEISSGVAIVCDAYWQTLKVRPQINKAWLRWDIPKSLRYNSEQLFKEYEKSFEEPPELDDEQELISSKYFQHYLAHATLEPQNCGAHFNNGELTVWSPTQAPTTVRNFGIDIADLPDEKVKVHVSKYLGGGFGRRSDLDFSREAIELALKVQYPVKVMWSREDDMKHSGMRPMALHRLDAVFEKGSLKSWNHEISSQSIIQGLMESSGKYLNGLGSFSGFMGWAMDVSGAVPMAVEGTDGSYDMDREVNVYEQELAIPTSFWRSVGHSFNGFVVESFLDEVAVKLGKDPLDYRLGLLTKNPRAKATLAKVAKMSNWRSYKQARGKALGIAYHFSFNTHVAEVAEIEVLGKQIKVKKVWCAVDCGIAVNPDIVVAQMKSGIIYGLGAVLQHKMTLKDGEWQQDNFDTYLIPKLGDVPDIDVAIIPSKEDPTGVGEPGLPPIAAAVGNAVFAATGKRLRELPFDLGAVNQ